MIQPLPTYRRARPQRGFTLVELLAVVAMIGILAALAIVGYRKYISSAQSSEAIAVIQGIRNAEQAHRSETLVYLSCSTTLNDLHPRDQAALDNQKTNWVQASSVKADCFKQLAVDTDGPVKFGYAVMAGLPTTAYPTAPTEFASYPTFPAAPTEPWFIVTAFGDRDEDGTYARFLGSSFQGSVYGEDDTE